MKTVLALLLLAAICSLHHRAAGQRNFLDATCCGNLTKVLIPKRMVASVTMTPGHCAVKAVIITTKAKKKFCVDPESQLVKTLKPTTNVMSPAYRKHKKI